MATSSGARSARPWRSAWTRDERWLCTLPAQPCRWPVDPRALVHLRDDRGRARALRDRPCAAGAARGRRHARVASWPRRSRACSTLVCERPRSLRCALTGGGPVPPALVARARERGVPVALTYGLTEACSQVTTTPLPSLGQVGEGGRLSAGPALFCTRLRIAHDGEILGQRSDRRAGVARARRLASHGRPRRAGRARAAVGHRTQGRHDRQRRRERRAAPRSRRRSRPTPTCRRRA